MFYCEDCGKKRGWPTAMYIPKSRGRCEICQKAPVECFDVASGNLPEPPKFEIYGYRIIERELSSNGFNLRLNNGLILVVNYSQFGLFFELRVPTDTQLKKQHGKVIVGCSYRTDNADASGVYTTGEGWRSVKDEDKYFYQSATQIVFWLNEQMEGKNRNEIDDFYRFFVNTKIPEHYQKG